MSKAQRRLAAKERHSTTARYASPGLADGFFVGLPVNLMAGERISFKYTTRTGNLKTTTGNLQKRTY